MIPRKQFEMDGFRNFVAKLITEWLCNQGALSIEALIDR